MDFKAIGGIGSARNSVYISLKLKVSLQTSSKKLILKANIVDGGETNNRMNVSLFNQDEVTENMNSNINFLEKQPTMFKKEIGKIFILF